MTDPANTKQILSPGDPGFVGDPPITPTPPITPDPPTSSYKLGDDGVVNSDGINILSSDLLTSSGYKITDNKVFDAEDKEIEITPDWIKSISDPEPEGDTINIDGTDYIIDENGDALKEDGSVFMDKAAIDKIDAPPADNTTINIDDKDYKLDDKGNALKEDGTVFMSKEDIDKASTVPDGTGISIKDVMKSINIDITDATGNTVEYEDTPAGIAKYASDVASKLYQEQIQESDSAILNEFPILPSVIEHLRYNNGNLDGFTGTTDYSNITIDENNEAQLDNLIMSARVAKGDTEAEAKDHLRYVTDDKKKVESAKSSLTFLQGVQQSQTTARDTLVADQRRNAADSAGKYWGVKFDNGGKPVVIDEPNSVYSKVMKDGKIALGEDTINLPENIRVKQGDGSIVTHTKEDFFNYMFASKPMTLDNGQRIFVTDHQIDLANKDNKRTVDNDIFDAFRLFTKGDDSQLIKQKLAQEKINKARKIVTGGIKKKITTTGRTIKLPVQ